MSYSFRPRELIAQSHSTAKYFEAINAKQAADDLKRVRFLEKLDRSDIKLSVRDAAFVESQLERLKPGIGIVAVSFSKKQCAWIDDLFHKYQSRVK